MSHASSDPPPDELDRIISELGGTPEPIARDPAADAVVAALQRVRGLLLEAAQAKGVGVREIARRLNVSPAAVSRQLRADGDMRISTAAMLAHAIGQSWKIELETRDDARHPPINDAA